MAHPQAPSQRYRPILDDSARWNGFAFRPGGVVISTPVKSGTTWTQMLCVLLIFDGPAFPAPLEALSPWLDICNRPLAEVTAGWAIETVLVVIVFLFVQKQLMHCLTGGAVQG